MRDAESGQMLMLVILIMVAAMTVGLSVAARTITNVRISSEEENSEKAFSAAEAGIEQTIGKTTGMTGTFENNSGYETKVNTLTGDALLLNNDIKVLKDNAVDLWLANYPNYSNTWSGTITIFWGNDSDQCTSDESTNSMAALEVLLIYGNKNTPKLIHYMLDPCQERSFVNHFTYITPSSGEINSVSFRYKQSITITNGIIARIIPLYAAANIGVSGCDSNNNNCSRLPSQGTVIESLGTADETKRKVIMVQSYPKLPEELFSFALFSPK